MLLSTLLKEISIKFKFTDVIFLCMSRSVKFKLRPIWRAQKSSSECSVMPVNCNKTGGKLEQPYNLLNGSGDVFDLKDLQVSKSFV